MEWMLDVFSPLIILQNYHQKNGSLFEMFPHCDGGGSMLLSEYTSYFIVVMKDQSLETWMLISLRLLLSLPWISEPSWMIHGILIPPGITLLKSSIESALNPTLSISHVWKRSQEITFRSSRSLHLTLKSNQSWNYTVQPKFSFTSHRFWENSL